MLLYSGVDPIQSNPMQSRLIPSNWEIRGLAAYGRKVIKVNHTFWSALLAMRLHGDMGI